MSQIYFDHIAIAMESMASAPAVLVGELGGVPELGMPSGVFRWGTWRFEGGGCIEIIEPMGEDGFVHRFLARRGPGIHHVTFRVPSLREACDRAEAHGYTIVAYDDSDPRWAEAFLHPKQALGIVVQFAELRAAGGGGGRRDWRPPPGPANPPPPVTILGLRLRARARERAQTQWELILKGECTEGAAGELVYGWPGSPMYLTVEIDPSRDEGPISIEFTSDRPVSLAEVPHAVLGTVFAQRAPS
ncbi:MAG: VOC family protein [Candidatus Methylomirabilia bacterium]